MFLLGFFSQGFFFQPWFVSQSQDVLLPLGGLWVSQPSKSSLAFSRLCKSSHVKVSMHGISILISGCVDFCLEPVTSTPNTPPLLMKKKHSLDIPCNKCPPVHNISSLSTATKQLCLFSCRCCFSPTWGVHILWYTWYLWMTPDS